jgi:hypothetical protein
LKPLQQNNLYTLGSRNNPTASFITPGIRLFTPSFIYMPTAKLPHKPFPNPARPSRRRAAQSARKNVALHAEWKKLQRGLVGKIGRRIQFLPAVSIGLIIGLAPEE